VNEEIVSNIEVLVYDILTDGVDDYDYIVQKLGLILAAVGSKISVDEILESMT
jgi:uncharacterized protein YbbC (DUF1343 family)